MTAGEHPVTAGLRELIPRSIFHVAVELGVGLPVLWYWPRGLKAIGHISHDTDGNDPKKAVGLLEAMPVPIHHRTARLPALEYCMIAKLPTPRPYRLPKDAAMKRLLTILLAILPLVTEQALAEPDMVNAIYDKSGIRGGLVVELGFVDAEFTAKRFPARWMLIARDAFNGVLLWKRPLQPWGWREWKPEIEEADWRTLRGQRGRFPAEVPRRLVAVGNRVYVTLGFHNAPVSILDAATGRVQWSQDIRNMQTLSLIADGDAIVFLRGPKLVCHNRQGRPQRLLAGRLLDST